MDEGLGDVALYATVGRSFAVLIGIAIELALLAVAVGPVRKHRPDASGLMVTAALVLLATSICAPIMSTALSMIAVQGSVQTIYAASAAGSVLAALMRAAGSALLIAAIARLAAPARNDPRDPS